jgi:hypothetical protein
LVLQLDLGDDIEAHGPLVEDTEHEVSVAAHQLLPWDSEAVLEADQRQLGASAAARGEEPVDELRARSAWAGAGSAGCWILNKMERGALSCPLIRKHVCVGTERLSRFQVSRSGPSGQCNIVEFCSMTRQRMSGEEHSETGEKGLPKRGGGCFRKRYAIADSETITRRGAVRHLQNMARPTADD